MSWRVARSLDQLLAQVNATSPGRDRRSDGAIGDAAHASSVSDHNPVAGIVHARDFTDDDLAPATMDAGTLAEQLRCSRDARIKYVICERRIFAGNCGPSPWIWRAYTGADPHTSHVHVSVVAGASADDPRAWALTPAKPKPAAPKPAAAAAVATIRRVLRQGAKGEDVRAVQRRVGATADGSYGSRTFAAVVAFQRRYWPSTRSAWDGVVGPTTTRALGLRWAG